MPERTIARGELDAQGTNDSRPSPYDTDLHCDMFSGLLVRLPDGVDRDSPPQETSRLVLEVLRHQGEGFERAEIALVNDIGDYLPW